MKPHAKKAQKEMNNYSGFMRPIKNQNIRL